MSKLVNTGGKVYLFEFAKNTPAITNIPVYAEIVRESSILRQLIEISREIAYSAFNPEGRENKEILDCVESKIFKIAEQRARGQGPVDINTLLTKTT
jgi:replicative DNA helicase